MKPVLFAILAGLCWGIGEVCTKSVLHTHKVGPMTVLLVRTGLALPPALLAYWIAHRFFPDFEARDWWRAGTRTLLLLTLGSALMAGFGGVFFFYLGMDAGDITIVKPIAFTLAPTIAVLLGWLVLGESMSAQKAIGIALILAGVITLTTYKPPQAAPPEPQAAADGRG
jgi:drug/metabolite transporter (DMT)-like permease